MRKSYLFLCAIASIGSLYSCQKSTRVESSKTSPEVIASVSSTTATEECGQFRTQTQGGWGAPPHGNNPGAYLHANFAAAFPGGLTVGCASGNWVAYTSALAITEFLPAGGTPGVLKTSVTNPPNKSIKNVLIGQVTALALSVGFDSYDPNFAPAEIHLSDMVIGSGTFAGKTVGEFLTIANDILGGCSDAYSPTAINEEASKINENFDDGKSDNGFLVCPGPRNR